MNPRNLFFAVAAVIVLGATFTLRSQGLTDGVKVTLPEPVTVGDKVLDPGEYEIRRVSTVTDSALRIFSNDKLQYQTSVLTIPVLDKETPEKTRVILHHIGDKYYFDKIWMEGKDYGYEFVLPEKVRSQQRELALTVPATYSESKSIQESPALQPAKSTAPESSAEISAVDQDKGRSDAAARELEDQREAQAKAEHERQEQAERDSVAALQRDQNLPAQTPVDAKQDRSPATQPGDAAQSRTSTQNQDNAQKPDQLPATASDWFAYVLGGCLLLTTAAFFRKPCPQG